MTCRSPVPSRSVAKQSLPPIAVEHDAAGDAHLVAGRGVGLEVRVFLRGPRRWSRYGGSSPGRGRRPLRGGGRASPGGRASARADPRLGSSLHRSQSQRVPIWRTTGAHRPAAAGRSSRTGRPGRMPRRSWPSASSLRAYSWPGRRRRSDHDSTRSRQGRLYDLTARQPGRQVRVREVRGERLRRRLVDRSADCGFPGTVAFGFVETTSAAAGRSARSPARRAPEVRQWRDVHRRNGSPAAKRPSRAAALPARQAVSRVAVVDQPQADQRQPRLVHVDRARLADHERRARRRWPPRSPRRGRRRARPTIRSTMPSTWPAKP